MSSSKDFGTIVQIGNILVSEDVLKEEFVCNYSECKGICCVEGDSGAPLEEEELQGLECGYREYSSLMSGEGRKAALDSGFFAVDRDGDLVTPLVADSRECAYCHHAGDGSLMCAIEKAGLVKPASCRLYPIRVTKLSGGSLALNVHHWPICKGAFEKGAREGVKVYRFLEKPLTDCFGKDFYEALDVAAQHLDSMRDDN